MPFINMKAWLFPILVGASFLSCVQGRLCAQTRTVRVVTYNIAADIHGVTTPLPGLIAPPGSPTSYQAGGVLEGIGEEQVNGNAQPLDVLALQETTSNSQTVTPIVNALNTFYGVPGMYAISPYQALQSGSNGDGNGPNALVYNTRTLQLVASTGVDPSGGAGNLGDGSGELRETARYEFAPAGVALTASNVFYVYVSHYKSGTSSSDLTERAGEAQIIRTNEAIDLPATARVIYVGDYNITTSGEASYQTILATVSPNGLAQGGAMDPFNPNGSQNINWGASTTATNILAAETEHSYKLEYRDDLQLMTTNIYYGTAGGLKYLPGTYHTFGNTGQIAYNGTVNNGANPALSHLVTNGAVFIPASQLYLDLTNASDHLPVVADYAVPLPAPLMNGVNMVGTNLVVTVTNGMTNGVLTLLTSTNLTLPWSNWSAVATATIPWGIVMVTATNAWSPAQPCGFFLLREN